MGRNTQGVRLVNLKSDDRVVGLGIISAEDQAMSPANGADEADGETDTNGETGQVEPATDGETDLADSDSDSDSDQDEGDAPDDTGDPA